MQVNACIEDRIVVKDSKQNKYGFYDRSGNLIISPKFDFISNFSEGICFAVKNSSKYYIDKMGNTVISF
jgi:hypothetical protein